MQWSVAEVAGRLKLPVAIIEAIERDDLERLGASVYARGYLVSYARLVSVPVVVVDSAMQQIATPLPPLHSATHVSHGRYLVERYARRAASIVLTASIVVPVVWLATEQRLPVQPAALQSLESPTMADAADATGQAPPEHASDFVGPPSGLAGAASVGPIATADLDSPVVASFAPFLGSRASAREEPAGVRGWKLVFRGDSWVEIVDRDGRRLEFGVIRAGSERRYPNGTLARVALGNATVVDVERDGEKLPLAPFQRANVARFAVSSDGELTPAGG